MPFDFVVGSISLDFAKKVAAAELTGDADVGDVKEGKTFYKDDPETRLTGTMPTEAIVAAHDDYEAGYHAGNPGGLDAIDIHLAPGNIKLGVDIFGKVGTFTQSLAEDVEGDTLSAVTTNVEFSLWQNQLPLDSEEELSLVSKTLGFDASSLAFAAAFCNGKSSTSNLFLRLYMGGVLMQTSVAMDTGKSLNYCLRDFKALSGDQTCELKVYNGHGVGNDLWQFGRTTASQCPTAIAVGSVKLT